MSEARGGPTVSVVMATYNRSELLPYTIGAVQRQTWLDWELIVVGDGCTDDTAQVVGALARPDPRIRFVEASRRYGEQSGPNNEGMALARGRYVAFLNHDDLWLADHLQRSIEALERLGADLVYPLPTNIDRHGVTRLSRVAIDDLYHPDLYVPPSFWLMRRGLANDVGPWRMSREIWSVNPSQDFLYRAWKAGKRMAMFRAVTCLVFASGGRPGGYKLRDASEAAAWSARIRSEPELVKTLLIDLAIDTYAHEHRPWRDLRRQFGNALALFWWRQYQKAGGNPQGTRGFLRFRPKGAWIDRLYADRGLPPRDGRL
jgi:glycosyltransferase involved in cell wall biosynthesis